MRFIQMIAVVGLVIAPSAARAQHTQVEHGKAGASGRVAGIAPAPTPVVVNPIVPPGTFLTGSIPVIVSPDGRVFADFGRGYEQIVTACGAQQPIVVTNMQTTNIQPTVVQPTVAQPGIVVGPLPYTPAVPNQQTASQQMIARAATPAQQPQQVAIGNGMCWSSNGRGQVYISRQ